MTGSGERSIFSKFRGLRGRSILLACAKLSFSLIFLALSAGAEELPHGLQPIPYTDSASWQAYTQEQMAIWIPISWNQFQVLPDIPVFRFRVDSQREFIADFIKVKSELESKKEYAVGQLSEQFLSDARNIYEGCGIADEMRKKYPDRYRHFQQIFYQIHIHAVDFNLCPDSDLTNCHFKDSLTAKNFPELNLILVNAVKWNISDIKTRSHVAVHEIDGIIGVEKDNYGLSSSFDMVPIRERYGNGTSTTQYCFH